MGEDVTMDEHADAVVFTRGPYLRAAFVCEAMLIEQDGNVSAIRMIDRLTLTHHGPGTAPKDLPATVIPPMKLVLMMVSGEARGSHEVIFRTQKPSGEHAAEASISVLFEGGDRSIAIIADFQLEADQEGLYWIDAFLNDKLITRIPLRILYARVQTS